MPFDGRNVQTPAAITTVRPTDACWEAGSSKNRDREEATRIAEAIHGSAVRRNRYD